METGWVEGWWGRAPLDPATGAVRSRVELHLAEAATALEVAQDGALLVVGQGRTLFAVDPRSGAGSARGRTGDVLVAGLDFLP